MPATNNFSEKNKTLRSLFYLIAIIIFYVLIRELTPAMEKHLLIVESLISGQNWGRQAFVGSLEYPPLPTLILLILRVPCQLLRINAGILYGSLALVFCLNRFFNLHKVFGKTWQFFMLLLIPVLSIIFWNDVFFFLKADPGWLAAALYFNFFYCLCLWQHNQALRHLVFAGLTLSLLTLCGINAMILVLFSLPIVLYDIKRKLNDAKKFEGIPFLLLLPALYGFFLVLLWNWLVMDNALFFLQDFWTRAGSLKLASFAAEADIRMLFFFIPALVFLLIAAFFSDQASSAKMLILPFILLPIFTVCSKLMMIHSAATAAIAGISVWLVFIILSYSNFKTKACEVIAAVSVLIMFFCGFAVFSQDKTSFIEEKPIIPEREELCNYIDQFWPDSRIMLYGLPLASSYPDTEEKRFVARLDYQEDEFLKQAVDEQMHMLIPPPDGIFYPVNNNSPYEEIYKNGKPWLLLEKTFANNWQLWRCVLAPEGESKLDILD